MAIEIKEVTKQGDKCWIHTKCPQCDNKITISTKIGDKRERKIKCSECNAEFIITWAKSDEAIH